MMIFTTDDAKHSTANVSIIYREPPPPTPADGEVGTELEQTNAAFLSCDLAASEGVTASATWARAYRIVMQRDWQARSDAQSDGWQQRQLASQRRLAESIKRLRAVNLDDGGRDG